MMLPDAAVSVSKNDVPLCFGSDGSYRTRMRRGRSAVVVAALLVSVAACSSGALVLGRLDESNGALPSPPDARAAEPLADGAVDAETCEPPPPARHYTFDGVGTEVLDTIGGPSGHVLGGAALDGSGVLHLDGVDDYVDLPNGIFAGREEVTIALWVRYWSRPAYTRLLDFGSSSLGEDPPADTPHGGKTYLALTPSTGFVPSGLAVLVSQNGPAGESVVATNVEFEREQMRMVVVVVAKETLSLFYEARLVTRVPRTIRLSAIVDQNVWLGRSQYSSDPQTEADYADLRIYGEALTDCAVTALYQQGPSPI